MAYTGGRIDFHTHILPGVDDGSRSSEESIQMLCASSKDGVDGVVLTPHFYADGDDPEKFLSRRSRAYSILLEALDKVSDMKTPHLILGSEVEYFEGILCMRDYPELRIGKSGCLLLEMPHGAWTSRMVDDILQLNEFKGFRVVLAHVERYLFAQKKDIIHVLLENGVLMQSNASFFTDRMTTCKAIRKLKHGYIHLLGSDCHNLTTRAPNLGDACSTIIKRAGEELLEELMQGAQQLLCKDLSVMCRISER